MVSALRSAVAHVCRPRRRGGAELCRVLDSVPLAANDAVGRCHDRPAPITPAQPSPRSRPSGRPRRHPTEPAAAIASVGSLRVDQLTASSSPRARTSSRRARADRGRRRRPSLCRGRGSRRRPRAAHHPVGRDLLRRRRHRPTPTVERFAADAPDFVNASVFKTRLEQALIKADAAGADDHPACSAARCPIRSTRRSRSPSPISPTGRRSAPRRSPAPSGSTTSSMPATEAQGARQARRPADRRGPLGARRAPDDARPRQRRPSGCSSS